MSQNPNQDIIDIIRLNKLEDMNENSLLPEDEKQNNRMVIKRNRQEKMNRVRLQLTPEQVAEAKKQEKTFEESTISEKGLGEVKRTEIKE